MCSIRIQSNTASDTRQENPVYPNYEDCAYQSTDFVVVHSSKYISPELLAKELPKMGLSGGQYIS